MAKRGSTEVALFKGRRWRVREEGRAALCVWRRSSEAWRGWEL